MTQKCTRESVIATHELPLLIFSKFALLHSTLSKILAVMQMHTAVVSYDEQTVAKILDSGYWWVMRYDNGKSLDQSNASISNV